MLRLFSVALLLSAASAFAPAAPAFMKTAPAVSSSTARFAILGDDETDAMIKKANECAESECSVEDVGDLLFELKGQQVEMEIRLALVSKMVADLKKINGKSAPEKSEVQQFVKDMMRVFAHEKTPFPASGYSGDIGDGPTTAYDALPPKKWKQ